MSLNGGNAKVIVVGLDGATFELIKPWAEAGLLPTFWRLIREGAHGDLESAPNQRSAASWTSFMTGKNPGMHGIYEFYDYVENTYDIRFINGSIRSGKSLWRLLSDQGRRVGVINVPMTYPAEEVNGFLIAGLDAPGPDGQGFTYPSGLIREVEGEVGRYILEPGLTGLIVGNQVDLAMNMLEKELTQKTQVAKHLMEKHPWEFFMVVFRSVDAAQHCFWKYMDSGHPQYREEEHRRYGETILKTYQRVDAYLRELVEGMADDTTLILVSDHGFGRKHPATAQLNLWLESQGYLRFLPEERAKGVSGRLRRTRCDLLGALYRAVVGKTSRSTKEALVRRLPRLRDKVQSRLCFSGIDWSGTLAYSDSLFPTVLVNLRGEAPLGVVVPGKEYKELVARLKRDLLQCRDVTTGARIVAGVFHREEIYHGPYVKKAPDLLIRWREDVPIHGIAIEGLGASRRDRLLWAKPLIPGEDPAIISGDHHLQGIFIACGKSIRGGVQLQGTKIVDVAPTVLYAMGCPVPSDMDGQVLLPIFRESFLRDHAVRVAGSSDAGEAPARQAVYSASESEEIKNRLRDLGYFE